MRKAWQITWLALGIAAASWAETKPAHDQHWSVQPLKVALPAALKAGDNPIDAFVRGGLAQKSLSPALSEAADRRTLIRRLSFDLLGLPPAPERVQAFEQDRDPRADERLVDELLASPHYGERWAQHWLDIAHYADTHGFERDQLRPNAWRYRDYVINAFNNDKPYDQFLREQISGDVLFPDQAEAVIATGFLAAGPWDYVGQVETKSPMLRRAARAGDLDDMVTQVMTSTMAMTVNCARCHDHKLDPITQEEYYQLAAVFSGVKRGEREVSRRLAEQHATTKAALAKELQATRLERSRLCGDSLSLADIVGGGDGHGSGTKGKGIDPRRGTAQSQPMGYLSDVVANRFVRSPQPFVEGVVIPAGGEVPISSTGLRAKDLRTTSGKAWDAIRNGAVNSQHSTVLGGIDFAKDGHTLLGLHANAGITFDLATLRKAGQTRAWQLVATVGYFGAEGNHTADYLVLVDGVRQAGRTRLSRKDGLQSLRVDLPDAARFLTLMVTDGGDGLAHDQVCFADARLEPVPPPAVSASQQAELAALSAKAKRLEGELSRLSEPAKVYAVQSSEPEVVQVLKRGDPESPLEEVKPGVLSWIKPQSQAMEQTSDNEGQRRVALAQWITEAHNPLTARVLVNRLWQHHFGQGIVLTPSDFGHGGDRPSHPELLDWLASELITHGWSLKHLHRLMLTSATYCQSSVVRNAKAERIDATNRLLWRQNPRRLDAESLRDAVLAISGKLNAAMGGPGYRDFRYTEAYAPVYDYLTPDAPELWRRSVYRFVVRTTPHQFMTTLDCPNPANFTPTRLVTTTALQALTLSNNEFMLKQAGYFAERLKRDAGVDEQRQVLRAFLLAFGRPPSANQQKTAEAFVQTEGLPALCRMLLNANEFVYVD